MDFNLRKNDGHGSAYIFELFECCECCSRMGVADPRFWKRHLGNDALFTMWFLSIGASAMWLGVLGSLVLDPTDTQMRFLMVDGTILLAAMWLMLGAAYPENFNKSTFFGEYSDEQEAPGTPRGQMRRDSNSRIFAPAGSPRDGAADAATERDRYETLYRGPGLESLVWSGRCWEVHEARNGWVNPAHAPSDLSAWRRCCCKVLLDIPLMMAKRDLDVPTACKASPLGVSTKAIV